MLGQTEEQRWVSRELVSLTLGGGEVQGSSGFVCPTCSKFLGPSLQHLLLLGRTEEGKGGMGQEHVSQVLALGAVEWCGRWRGGRGGPARPCPLYSPCVVLGCGGGAWPWPWPSWSDSHSCMRMKGSRPFWVSLLHGFGRDSMSLTLPWDNPRTYRWKAD